MIVIIKGLTMQALQAFIGIDMAIRMDRLDHAFTRTTLAGIAALAITA